jgi:hypothetical protein
MMTLALAAEEATMPWVEVRVHPHLPKAWRRPAAVLPARWHVAL